MEKLKVLVTNAKILKIGSSYGVTIPSDFIKHGLIQTNKIYNVSFMEVEKCKT